jgi:uncharacterized membrane protein
MRNRGIREGRAFERFINFTDAVVAIAITLMALPLIDIEGPGPDETVWQVIAANSGTILIFFFAFAIVANSWFQHNRIVNDMRGYDAAVFWLNIAWIAVIAVIPWAANLYGSASDRFQGGEGLGGTGLFFYLLLAIITFIGLLISKYVNRHPELLEPDRADRWRQDRSVSDAVAITLIITFLAIGVASLFFPTISSYLPLVLIPLIRFVTVRRFRPAAEPA